MTYEEIKQTLSDVEQAKRKVNNLAKSIADYRDKLTSPRGISYSKSKVQTPAGNQREDELVELADLCSLYDNLLSDTLQTERRVYDAINLLDLEEQNIIIEKYIHGNTWETVAENFHYSPRSIYNKLDRILKKLSLYDFYEKL